ncbi:MAG: GNAT family N-acetyltransferase [Alistipes sp.]|nr:GNAT family N-acetyltransferase [Alistipes sp.]
MIRIEGEKVILRSVDSSDIDTILLWENSSSEPLYGVYEEQYTREDVVQFVENQQRYSLAETEQLRLMICSHSEERLGCVDLTEYDGESAFISILIFSLDNRGKGLGYEALQMLISYAESLGLQRLYATILPENLVSVSLFKKAGFVREKGDRYLLVL